MTKENRLRAFLKGAPWNITEAALTRPGAESLARLCGHCACWFARQSYKAGKPMRVD